MGRERRFFVGNGNSTRWYCVFAHVPDTMIVSIWARRSTLTRGGLSPLLSMITSLNVKRASSSAVRLSRQRGKPTWRNSADREMPKVIASGNSSLRNDCRSAKTHRPGERHGSLYLDRVLSALIAVSMIPLRRFRVAVASLASVLHSPPLCLELAVQNTLQLDALLASFKSLLVVLRRIGDAGEGYQCAHSCDFQRCQVVRSWVATYPCGYVGRSIAQIALCSIAGQC